MWPFTRKPRLTGLKKAFEALDVLEKARVKGHWRQSPEGKMVWVAEHQDKRTKKAPVAAGQRGLFDAPAPAPVNAKPQQPGLFGDDWRDDLEGQLKRVRNLKSNPPPPSVYTPIASLNKIEAHLLRQLGRPQSEMSPAHPRYSMQEDPRDEYDEYGWEDDEDDEEDDDDGKGHEAGGAGPKIAPDVQQNIDRAVDAFSRVAQAYPEIRDYDPEHAEYHVRMLQQWMEDHKQGSAAHKLAPYARYLAGWMKDSPREARTSPAAFKAWTEDRISRIEKSLDCGTGTDAATMTGGRATIRESLSGAGGTRPKRRRKFRRLADLLDARAQTGGGA